MGGRDTSVLTTPAVRPDSGSDGAVALGTETYAEVRALIDEQRREVCRLSWRHQLIATEWRIANVWLALGAAVLAGIGGVSAVATNETWAGWLSIAGAVVAACIVVLKPEANAAQHHANELAYADLRDAYEAEAWQLIGKDDALVPANVSVDVRTRLAELEKRHAEIRADEAPLGPDWLMRFQHAPAGT